MSIFSVKYLLPGIWPLLVRPRGTWQEQRESWCSKPLTPNFCRVWCEVRTTACVSFGIFIYTNTSPSISRNGLGVRCRAIDSPSVNSASWKPCPSKTCIRLWEKGPLIEWINSALCSFRSASPGRVQGCGERTSKAEQVLRVPERGGVGRWRGPMPRDLLHALRPQTRLQAGRGWKRPCLRWVGKR